MPPLGWSTTWKHPVRIFSDQGVPRPMVVLFLIPCLVLAIVAAVPAWPYNRNWGYIPSGGLGAILVITIVLLFLNRI